MLLQWVSLNGPEELNQTVAGMNRSERSENSHGACTRRAHLLNAGPAQIMNCSQKRSLLNNVAHVHTTAEQTGVVRQTVGMKLMISGAGCGASVQGAVDSSNLQC